MDNNIAPFPRLRAAYLRAVARAWNDPAYLRVLIEASSTPRGVLPMLEEEFGFNFPFNVRLILTEVARPLWEPVSTTGWFGFGDGYKMYLPKAPPADQAASVLGWYCAEFPSLLGAATDGVSVAPPDFSAFGVVMSRIAALAWKSEKFARALYSIEDSRVLIQDAMDCIIPWNFSLTVREAPGESSTAPEYWAAFPRSEIILHIPEAPVLDEQAVALGAYNATGAQYPFSC